MKRLLLLVGLVALAVVPVWASGQKGSKQVLMIVRDFLADMPYMLDKEVGTMTSMLREAGYYVVVASDSGKAINGGPVSLKVEEHLSGVRIKRYAGVIIPCMAAGDAQPAMRVPDSAVTLVKQAFDAGLPIAAQNSAVEILGRAGIMKGKQYAVDAAFFTFVPGGIYKGYGVVQDGKIISSGTCPYLARETARKDGTRELTQRLIDTMSASE